MKSATPKVLHTLGGRPMIDHAICAARGTHPQRIGVIVRHEGEKVAGYLSESAPDVEIAWQDDIPGTGRAVECALAELDARGRLEGPVVVVAGDTPLLDGETLARLLATHVEQKAAVTVLSCRPQDATGYGRILRDEAGAIVGVVEHKDASSAQRAITEVNTSNYVFDAHHLREALGGIGRGNAQGEKYLTDVIEIVAKAGGTIASFEAPDAVIAEGVNDRQQLAVLARELNARIVARHMRAGVTMVDPQTTWIDVDVELAQDVTLLPNCQLHGNTRVATGAVIGPDTTLSNTQVDANAQVVRSHVLDSHIGAGANVGPFSYLRPGTVLGACGKIGGFVETKNAIIGERSKVPHLSYVGDAEIGTDTNIGAATIFVNYDGVRKHRTRVGSHVRIGSDNTLIAPVVIADGVYTGAGSVIKEDVPPGALAVSQPRQRTIPGWVELKRPDTESARAARVAREDDE